MSFLSSIIGPVVSLFGKILPFLAAYKYGKDKQELKSVKKHNKRVRKARDVDNKNESMADIKKRLKNRSKN